MIQKYSIRKFYLLLFHFTRPKGVIMFKKSTVLVSIVLLIGLAIVSTGCVDDETSEEHTLELEVQGEGIVVVNGDEVNDGGNETFEEGTEVNLTASPDEGWKFVEWKGDYSSTERHVSITIEEDMDITAVFEEDKGGEGMPLAIDIDAGYEEDEERITVEFVAMSTPSSAKIENINADIYDGASEEILPVDEDYIADPGNWVLLVEEDEATGGSRLIIEEDGFDGDFPAEPEEVIVTIDSYDGSAEDDI